MPEGNHNMSDSACVERADHYQRLVRLEEQVAHIEGNHKKLLKLIKMLQDMSHLNRDSITNLVNIVQGLEGEIKCLKQDS